MLSAKRHVVSSSATCPLLSADLLVARVAIHKDVSRSRSTAFQDQDLRTCNCNVQLADDGLLSSYGQAGAGRQVRSTSWSHLKAFR